MHNAITVGGSDGKFPTIQEAVNALSNTTKAQTIFIWPGVYEEQVYVSKHAGPISIVGYSANDTSYHANTVTLTSGLSQAFNLTNDLTATLRAHSPHFNVYNLNIANTYGEGSQAVAVSAMATHQAYYGCKMTGYQDTLLSHIGKHYIGNTYIEGTSPPPPPPCPPAQNPQATPLTPPSTQQAPPTSSSACAPQPGSPTATCGSPRPSAGPAGSRRAAATTPTRTGTSSTAAAWTRRPARVPCPRARTTSGGRGATSPASSSSASGWATSSIPRAGLFGLRARITRGM
ncbi:hypothetical protein SLS55_010389 [Diplodia seriata]|uniref:pectinesterase n=1 Tax=Diplodia seriata TaxID=420778 RepID=A0ABR3BZV7_9PEZI